MKGILFKSEMIQATIEGRETQTRRVIKPQPPQGCSMAVYTHDRCPNLDEWVFAGEDGDPIDAKCPQPPYQVGEAVYIQEKIWRIGEYAIYYSDSKPVMFLQSANRLKWRWQRQYLSPIHLPYEAARYFLKIKDVRAERLQEITEEDAIAEGMRRQELPYDIAPVWQYQELWDSINKDYPWESNPWVFRYEFEYQTKEKV